MEKKEILEKAQSKKALVGEYEAKKVNQGLWISLVIAGVIAVALIIAECAQKHFTGGFAIASVCYGWASLQYTLQFFMAHRPWPVLIGAVLHGLAFVACIVLYSLFSVGVL